LQILRTSRRHFVRQFLQQRRAARIADFSVQAALLSDGLAWLFERAGR
jgi:hypothetical protein